MRTRARIDLLVPRSSSPRNTSIGDEVQTGYPQEILRWDLGLFHALRSFELEKVLKANRRLKHAAMQLRLNKQVVLPDNSMDQFCKPAIPGARSLRRIKLSDCKMNCWHEGCVLTGTLRDQAFSFGRLVVSAVEDEAGSSTRLTIRNKIDWGTPAEVIEKMYPQGAQVAIQDPCLVREAVRIKGNTLWVSNPATVKVVSYYPHITASKGFDKPNLLKELGDKDFLCQNYPAAIELYTKCIQLCEEQQEILVQALCHRAEAYVRLGCLFQALEDTERVLSLDSRRGECYWTRGRALVGLRQYVTGSECLRKASELSPDSYTIGRACKDSVLLKEQSEQGKLSFRQYVDAVGHNVSDYIGPVTIKMTTDGKGRGLFATSRISKGDVVLVMNPAVSSPNRVHYSDFLNRVLSASVNCPRTRAQLHALHDEQEVPDMMLFKPNWEDFDHEKAAEGMEVDVAGVERMVVDVACRHCRKANGLWTLPVFMNHSCLPNVSVKTLGQAKYACASRDIDAGGELLVEYGNVLAPYTVRRGSFTNFQCQCQRCELEKELDSRFEYINKCFQAASEDVKTSRLHSHRDALAEMKDTVVPTIKEELADIALRVEHKVRRCGQGETKSQWLRASYAEAYVHYYMMRSKGHAATKLYEDAAFCNDAKTGTRMPTIEEFLQALHQTAAGCDRTYKWMLICSRVVPFSREATEIMHSEYVASYGAGDSPSIRG